MPPLIPLIILTPIMMPAHDHCPKKIIGPKKIIDPGRIVARQALRAILITPEQEVLLIRKSGRPGEKSELIDSQLETVD